VQALDGSWIVLSKNGSISVHNAEGRELERHNVVIGSMVSKDDGASVKKGETFVQWDPYNVPILTDKSGRVEFRDMIAGVTIKRDVDEATGLMGTVIIEHKEDLHPQIVIVGDKKEVLSSYSIPAGAHVIVEEGHKVRGGAPPERRGRNCQDRWHRRDGRNPPWQAPAHSKRFGNGG
jgi:DNA-directed RNA polymerase subunit beta'